MLRRIFSLLLLFASPALAAPVFIEDIPAYNWYHGCGPTAAASVLGYWDLHGYPNLFDASGKDVFLTSNVQDQISSPAHNAKYDPSPDVAILPVPPKTSIADFFRTSVNQAYGWSWQGDAPAAFTGYSAYRGYEFSATVAYYGGSLWSDLVREIGQNHPSMFLVDSDGNGSTDHFVPVLGYDDRSLEGLGLWYGYYTTWGEGETIQWSQYHGMSIGDSWGVYASTFVDPVSSPVPEPTTVLLLGAGLAVLAGCGKYRPRTDRRRKIA